MIGLLQCLDLSLPSTHFQIRGTVENGMQKRSLRLLTILSARLAPYSRPLCAFMPFIYDELEAEEGMEFVRS